MQQRQKVDWWMPKAGGGKNGDLLFNGYRITVFQDEEFWRFVAQWCESTCG